MSRERLIAGVVYLEETTTGPGRKRSADGYLSRVREARIVEGPAGGG
jgi:hypothetical protein